MLPPRSRSSISSAIFFAAPAFAPSIATPDRASGAACKPSWLWRRFVGRSVDRPTKRCHNSRVAVDLDSVDLKILTLLSKDGRLPAAQLGEQVGLSRPAVAERIEKLERNGVIRGTT